MSDEPISDVPLTRATLFQMIADEVCRDGIVEPYEKVILQQMARFLRLEPEEAWKIAMHAWNIHKDATVVEQSPIDPLKLYSLALKSVISEWEIDHLEERVLAGLRKLLHLSDENHKAILKEIESEGKPNTVIQNDSKAEIAPRIPLPTPGSTTDALGMRLAHDPLEAWLNDHRYWFPLKNNASTAASRGWKGFIEGMANGDEGVMYDGLDALDDVLNSLENLTFVDVVLALAVVRWSRVLLKTTFSANEVGDARHWPGLELYRRLCVKMGPILISIDHLRDKTPIENALAMALVFLLEDLCMLAKCRHAEPIGSLGCLISYIAKISPKSQVSHRAVDLIRLLTSMVARQGGAIIESFVTACRDICHCMPQNHPLTLAAHTSIMSLAPKQAMFPASYSPRANTSSSPSFPQAVQRLERLITEISSQDEEERLFIKALSSTDLSPVDEILSATTSSHKENKLEPAAFLFRELVAMIFPVLPGIPRPVVAFFALGSPGGHHEEMKGGWVQIMLKKLDGNSIQTIPKFPVFPSTSLMSVPLKGKDAIALGDALDRSGGAYDVVLVDPGRKGVRIWHQVGDLDPTGNLFRVEEKLLSEEKFEEADKYLDQALSRHPWMSRAWVRKGLIAKQGGDLKTARQAFERALEVQPHDPHSLTRLGVLEKGEDQMESSEMILRNALRILPTEPSAIVTLASLALSRIAGGENAALPTWDYYVAGLHASQGNGEAFREIVAVGDSFDPSITSGILTIPVDTVFYL
ncbi:MAG: hypothetical protein HQM09_17315 [Candidatus Riflebacteria bacterium]|nr:hypothetical protein [Candidatus Riflebacteria bacterium]